MYGAHYVISFVFSKIMCRSGSDFVYLSIYLFSFLNYEFERITSLFYLRNNPDPGFRFNRVSILTFKTIILVNDFA